jgi:glycosyltransferase involved in cell wall biosynthesis
VKVTLATYGFPTYQQSFLEQYVEALVGLGTDVCVAASEPSDHELAPLSADSPGSLTVVSAPWNAARVRKMLLLADVVLDAARSEPRTLGGLTRSLQRRHGFGHRFVAELYALAPALSTATDVVHFAWLGAAIRSIELLRVLGRPLVVSCNGSDLLIDTLLGERYLEPLAEVLARADLVHCVSRDLAGRAVALGADAAKVVVCPWGVDTRRIDAPSCARERRRRDPLRVLTVSRVHWVKGYDYALQALARIQHAGIEVEYTVVGHADDKARLSVLASARDLGLLSSVRVTGTLPHDEIVEMMKTSDVFLLASLCEGVSIATLDAMAAGLPVVVTDVGGTREVVTDGVQGFVVPPRDPDALADALSTLAADADLRSTMGREGRLRALAEFDVESCARQLAEAYARLVAGGNR